MSRRLLLAVSLSLAAACPALAETYQIDPGHTQVRFGYSHFGYSNIVGLLGGIEGELVYDPASPETSAVSVRIPLASLQTGVAKLDEHLKSDDFFNIAQHPMATFTSTAVSVAGEGRLAVAGDLVVHGNSRPVTLQVQLNKRAPHPMTQAPSIGFDATTTLKRSDFGVEKSAPNVSDEVSIEITVEARVPKA